MNRTHIAFLCVTLATATAMVLLARPAFGASSSVVRAEATVVVNALFRSLNERRYGRTCDLLSKAYYEENRIPSRRHCVISLRVGFMWSQELRYRITSVAVTPKGAVVEAVVDGSPGRILLVRERRLLKVLSLEST